MYTTNLILKQLELSNKLANSDLPQENRMALILLDNIFEVVIKSRAEHRFMFDSPRWFDNDELKYPEKTRRAVRSHFDQMLDFAVDEEFLNPDEKRLITFCHGIRNKTYHENDHDHRLTRLSVLIDMHILRKRLPEWRTGQFSYGITAHDKATENFYFADPFDISKEPAWREVVKSLTSHLDQSKFRASELLAEELEYKLQSITDSLDFLKEDLPDIDLNHANIYCNYPFERVRFPEFDELSIQEKIDFLIQFSFFVSDNRDCQDYGDDRERIDNLLERLRVYMSERDKRLKINYQGVSRKTEELKGQPIEVAIEKYQTLNNLIEPLYLGSNEAASFVAGYIDHMIDVARGK